MAARSVTAERIAWAVDCLIACRSTTAVVSQLSEREGISRRQAQRLVAQAHKILLSDIEQVGLDRREMVAQLVHALMESLSKALASNQPAAAVAAVRAIDDLCQLTPAHRKS
jgi:hypothetical protein